MDQMIMQMITILREELVSRKCWRAFIFIITRMRGCTGRIEESIVITGQRCCLSRWIINISLIYRIHHQVIVMAVKVDLVNTSHSLLGMVATGH